MADENDTVDTEDAKAAPAEGEKTAAPETGADTVEGADTGVETKTAEKDDKAEADWRQSIKDAKLRDHAGRFTTLDDVLRANLESRQKLSKAVIPPGKDAPEEEVSAYRKAIGVPDKPDDYAFPELPKEQLTDEVKAERQMWAETFHAHNVPKATAEALIAKVGEVQAEAQKRQEEADKAFAEESTAELKKEWAGDYEKNVNFASRALKEIAGRAGLSSDDMAKIETKDGRMLLDRPDMLKFFAAIGREMGEGRLDGTLTEGEKEAVSAELKEVRDKISAAQDKGDRKEANRLYQKEQELIARSSGNRPVVGSMGRAA